MASSFKVFIFLYTLTNPFFFKYLLFVAPHEYTLFSLSLSYSLFCFTYRYFAKTFDFFFLWHKCSDFFRFIPFYSAFLYAFNPFLSLFFSIQFLPINPFQSMVVPHTFSVPKPPHFTAASAVSILTSPRRPHRKRTPKHVCLSYRQIHRGKWI